MLAFVILHRLSDQFQIVSELPCITVSTWRVIEHPLHTCHHKFEKTTVRHIVDALADGLSFIREHFPVVLKLIQNRLADLNFSQRLAEEP